MTRQPTLWDSEPLAPAQRHSATSVEAARQIQGGAATLRQAVLNYLLACGDLGSTDEEAQLALNMQPSTSRPRRVELVNLGAVRDSGRTRLTRSGRKATVWVANAQ